MRGPLQAKRAARDLSRQHRESDHFVNAGSKEKKGRKRDGDRARERLGRARGGGRGGAKRTEKQNLVTRPCWKQIVETLQKLFLRRSPEGIAGKFGR